MYRQKNWEPFCRWKSVLLWLDGLRIIKRKYLLYTGEKKKECSSLAVYSRSFDRAGKVQTDEDLVRNSATGAETLVKMGEKIGEKCQKEPFSGENGGFSIAF